MIVVLQIFLAISISYVLFRFLASPNSSQTRAWKKIFLLLLLAFAIIVIFLPSITNTIAHALGIGRGADLLLYILTVVFLFEQLNRYIKQKDEQQRIVTLARKLAIIEANERYGKYEVKRQ